METATGNEIARMESGVVVVQDPFTPGKWHAAADADGLIRSSRERLTARREAANALVAAGEARPLAAVKELRRAVEADDKALRDFEARLRDALLDLAGFKGFVVQTRGTGAKIDPLSVRGGFADLIRWLKEREDAAKPDAPRHTYFYAVTATDAEHAAIRRAIGKADPNYAWTSVLCDEQDALAKRLFNWGAEADAAKAAADGATEGGAE